jgi:hypothetical protein
MCMYLFWKRRLWSIDGSQNEVKFKRKTEF